jgi:alpha/beta superfamily hydrolase
MTQSAVARFEAGGTVATLAAQQRLARALSMKLDIRSAPNVVLPDQFSRHAPMPSPHTAPKSGTVIVPSPASGKPGL